MIAIVYVLNVHRFSLFDMATSYLIHTEFVRVLYLLDKGNGYIGWIYMLDEFATTNLKIITCNELLSWHHVITDSRNILTWPGLFYRFTVQLKLNRGILFKLFLVVLAVRPLEVEDYITAIGICEEEVNTCTEVADGFQFQSFLAAFVRQ